MLRLACGGRVLHLVGIRSSLSDQTFLRYVDVYVNKNVLFVWRTKMPKLLSILGFLKIYSISSRT